MITCIECETTIMTDFIPNCPECGASIDGRETE